MSSSTPTPTTCAERIALGDTQVDLTNRETGALKQRCDEGDIRAKFAALDKDSDGYVILEDMPAEHMLSELFADVDFMATTGFLWQKSRSTMQRRIPSSDG